MEKFDMLILGAGPAGLSAAIYARRYNLSVLIIGGVPGGLMNESHKICNWPGEPDIAGWQLSKKMKDHTEAMGARLVSELVTEARREGEEWIVKTSEGNEFSSQAVLYALGTEHRKLGIPAEAKFKGKGVSYCATCDAMFHKGRNTAVIGSGNSAMTAALYLAEICPVVYLITRGSALKGEMTWTEEVLGHKNIVWIKNTNVVDMTGEDKLAEVVLDKAYEGADRLAVSGVFVEIGLMPKVELFKEWGGELDELGYVNVGPDMSTNLPAMYAAGDITNGSNRFRQILTAAAEGAIAATSAFYYLRQHKKQAGQ